MLSLSGVGGATGKPAFAFGVRAESYSEELDALLETLQALPQATRLRVEARCGMTLFAHVPAGMAEGRPLPQEAFARLQPHKDLTPNFFCTMKTDVVDRIKHFLLSHNFMAVPPEEVKVDI